MTISTDEANYNDLQIRKPGEARLTMPVGSFPANRFGLHDMHGNVFEWVEDCWRRTYRDTPADGSARLKENCRRRVMRGGSWRTVAVMVRSAFRFGDFATTGEDDVGFRVARILD